MTAPESARAAAGINQTLNYQGRLLTATGAVVPDGTYNMRFKIYQDGNGCVGGGSSPCSGTLKWTEAHTNSGGTSIAVRNGYFSVALGAVNAFGSSIDWNQDTLWLSTEITNPGTDTASPGSLTWDGEMLPFKRLAAAVYALNAGELGGLTSGQFVQLAQGVQTDSSTSQPSIGINKSNVGNTQNLITLQANATDIFDVSSSGNLLFGSNADKTISVATAPAASNGNTLTLQAGTGNGTDKNGGNLVLQGGNRTGAGTAGGVIVKPQTDTTAAFQVQNAAGTVNVLSVDTSGSNVNVNVGNAGKMTITSDLSGGARSTNALLVTQPNNAGNNSSSSLVKFLNSDTLTSAAVLNVDNLNAGGTGLLFSEITSGTAISAGDLATGLGFNFSGVSTGTGLQLGTSSTASNNLSSGVGLLYDVDANGLTSGSALKVTGTGTAVTSDYTGSLVDVESSRVVTSGTRNDPGHYLTLARTNQINNSGNTYTISGDLATLSSNCTQTAGTCTDTSSILSLNQQYANASGAVLKVQGSGTGNLLQLQTGTPTPVMTVSSTGAALFENSSDSTGAFRVQSSTGNTLFNVDTSTTLNLLPENASNFETGQGWSALGSGVTLSQNSADVTAYSGSNTLKIVTTAAGPTGAQYAQSFTSGTNYVFSADARLASGSMSTLVLGYHDTTDHDCNANSPSNSSWSRIYCAFTASASATGYLYIKDTSTSHTFYIDATQFETGTQTGSPYNPGGQLQLNGVISSPLSIKNSVNSNTALQVANANQSLYVLQVDTTGNGKIGIAIGGNGAPTYDLSFGSGTGNGPNGGRAIGINTNSTGDGRQLTLQGGISSGGSTFAGGGILLQGGNTNGSGAGGNITLTPGTSSGGGAAGKVIVKPASSGDSTTFFQIQNAAGNAELTVDTSAHAVSLGNASTLTGQLSFYNASGTHTVNIAGPTSDPTSSYTLNLPSAAPGLSQCLMSGGGTAADLTFSTCGGVGNTLQTAYAASVGSTTPEIKLNTAQGSVDIQDSDAGIGTNLFNVRSSNAAGFGQILFGVNGTGDTAIQSSVDSTTAFQVQNVAGSSLLTVDTSDTALKINSASAAEILNVGGGISLAGLPAPTGVSVSNVGTAGTTLYTYQVAACDDSSCQYQGTASSVASTSTGNATLSGTNYNTITWSAVTGAKAYIVYRVFGSSVDPGPAAIGNTTSLSYNDQGAAGISGSLNRTSSGSLTANGNVVSNGAVIANGQLFVGTGGGGSYTSTSFNEPSTAYVDGGLYLDQISTPSAPSVTPNGTTGSTSYTYYVAACSTFCGNFGSWNNLSTTPASTGTTITNGNTALSTSNYNHISWTAVAGANSYAVYKATGGTTYLQAIVHAGGTYYDDIGATAINWPVTLPTTNQTGNVQANLITGNASLAQNGNTLTIQGGNTSNDGGFGPYNGGNLLLQGGKGSATGSSGGVVVQPQTDVSTAFQLLNATGDTAINLDTTTTNSVSNPSIEQAISSSDWQKLVAGVVGGSGDAAAISRITSDHFMGSAALQLSTTANASDGAADKLRSTLSTATAYTLSFYIKAGSPTTIATTNISAGYSYDGTFANIGTATCGALSPTTTINANGWQQYSCTFTTTSSSPTSINAIFIYQNDATSRTFYLDAVQVDSGTVMQAFHEASLQVNSVVASPLLVQSTTKSTTALQVMTSGGSPVLTVDTVNSRVIAGATTQCTTGKFCAVQNLTSSGGGSTTIVSALNGYMSGGSIGNNTTIVAQSITANDTSSATGNTVQGISIDTSATTNTGTTVTAIQANDPVGNAGYLLQLQSSSANSFTVSNAGNQEGLGYYDNGVGGIGQYQNLLTYSEQLNNAAWTTSNASVASNNAVAPDGQTTAEELVNTSTSTAGKVYQDSGTSVGSTFTFSAWVKCDVNDSAHLCPTQGSLAISGTTTGAGTQAKFTPTSTWQRVSVTQDTSSFTGNVRAVVYPGTTTGVCPGASTNCPTIDVWGAQLVSGSVSLTYARTTSSTVGAKAGLVSNGSQFLSTASNAVFRNDANSSTAFQVQNAAGTSFFTVDTSTPDVLIGSTGTSTASSTAEVADTTDATGTQTVKIGSNANAANSLTLEAGNTGTIALGNAAAAHTINIGAGGGANNQAISLGSGVTGGSNTSTVTVGSNNVAASVTTIQGGSGTGASAAIRLSPADAGDINIGTTTQTGQITVGQSSATNTISIGSAAPNASATQTINIGNGSNGANASSAIAVNILSGSAGSAGADTLTLANNDRVTQVDVGNVVADAARTFNLFSSDATAVDTINIGTGNGTVAGAKTIHIGDGTPTGSGTNLITIGSIAALANTTTIQGGNGSGAVSIQSAASGTISLGSSGVANTVQIGNTTGAVAQTVNIGNNATSSSTGTVVIGSAIGSSITTIQGGTGGLVLKPITNNSTAFTLQDSASVKFLVVDSTTGAPKLYVGDPTADGTGVLLVLDSKNTSGDPTGVAGAMYYNSSSKKFRCYENGIWRDCIQSARTQFFASTDFTSGGADMNWFQVDTGGAHTVSTVNSVAGHPGIFRESGTNSGDASFVGSQGTDSILLGNSDVWSFEADVRIPTASDGTNTFTYRTGFIDSTTGEPTDGCYFRYTDDGSATGANGKWDGVCRSNNVETGSTCDVVSLVANTWYRLDVNVNGAGNSVTFSAWDGSTTSTCTVTSNVPTGAGRGTGFGATMVKSGSGTTQRHAENDYEEILGQLNTPR